MSSATGTVSIHRRHARLIDGEKHYTVAAGQIPVPALTRVQNPTGVTRAQIGAQGTSNDVIARCYGSRNCDRRRASVGVFDPDIYKNRLHPQRSNECQASAVRGGSSIQD